MRATPSVISHAVSQIALPQIFNKEGNQVQPITRSMRELVKAENASTVESLDDAATDDAATDDTATDEGTDYTFSSVMAGVRRRRLLRQTYSN